MFRLTSKGIYPLNPPNLIKLEPKEISPTDEQEKSDSICLKTEPPDEFQELNVNNLPERCNVRFEAIPKKEKFDDRNSAHPQTSKQYNLRRKSKSTGISLLHDVSDSDPTEDYEPDNKPEPTLPNSSKEFKCEFCPKAYTQKKRLKAHIIDIHVVDKEFQCSKCSRSFISQEKLDSHLRNHPSPRLKSTSNTNSKEEKCPTCGKAFRWKSELMKHEMSHIKDKRFKCEFCPKSFVMRAEFKLHIANRHDGEKPFKCPVCSKAFFLERDLIVNHLPYHSEDRNFECDKCVATFKTIKCLRQHIRKFCYARKETKAEIDSG